MFDFFVRTFIKNPKGLIVLGIIVTCLGPSINSGSDGSPAGYIIGITIAIIGIIWLVIKNKKERQAIAVQLPLYLGIVDALKKSGYEIEEFEHKADRIRSSVYQNDNHLGEVFLVAPPPSGRYAQFKRIEEMTRKDFQHDYSKKYGKSPGISASYWPDNSLIGVFIEWSAENYSEKGKWLTDVANIFKGLSA
jgi:hypothetical protein